MSDDDRRDKRRTPSSGLPVTPRVQPPSIPRTPTPSELAHEIRKMREMVGGRLDRLEQFTDGEILRFIQTAGARYTEVTLGLAHLGKQVEANTKSVDSWRVEVRDQFADHDDRLLAVEDKTARHHVRLDMLDDQQLDPRLRAVEQHAAGATAVAALTRKQKGGVALLSTIGGVLASLLSRLLGG